MCTRALRSTHIWNAFEHKRHYPSRDASQRPFARADAHVALSREDSPLRTPEAMTQYEVRHLMALIANGTECSSATGPNCGRALD